MLSCLRMMIFGSLLNSAGLRSPKQRQVVIEGVKVLPGSISCLPPSILDTVLSLLLVLVFPSFLTTDVDDSCDRWNWVVATATGFELSVSTSSSASFCAWTWPCLV